MSNLTEGKNIESQQALYLYAMSFADELVRSGVQHICICAGSRSTPLSMAFVTLAEMRDRNASVQSVRLNKIESPAQQQSEPTVAGSDSLRTFTANVPSRQVYRTSGRTTEENDPSHDLKRESTDGATEKPLHLWTSFIDERAAGYFALGLAKQLRQPVALLCTSGTAAANFFPAVVEAYHARVPLIVLTADLPHDFRAVGAHQTIDQIHLYGRHVKQFWEVAPPSATPHMLRYVRTLADRAVAHATSSPSGPVHLNFPFRKPLIPMAGESASFADEVEQSPHTVFHTSVPGIPHDVVASIAEHCRNAKRGIFVCGPQGNPRLAEAIAMLAAKLNWPILADPLSLVRCGYHDIRRVIDNYDAFLRHSRIVKELTPDMIIRFGAIPTSSALTQYMNRYRHVHQIVVDESPSWRDPHGTANEVVYSDPVQFCHMLAAALSDSTEVSHQSEMWMSRWMQYKRCTAEAIQDQMSRYDTTFEGRIFTELATILPPGSVLFSGSSMPVRDMDTFFPSLEHPVHFMANRGTNGIDGVVSSALGAAAGVETSSLYIGDQAGNDVPGSRSVASTPPPMVGSPPRALQPQSNRDNESNTPPVVLVIGDLSFYHDLNGLLAAKLFGLSLTIILVNNDGGGIFSFLDQASYLSQRNREDQFEMLFGTPLGLDYEPVVTMYGGSYHLTSDWPDFRQAVTRSLESDGLTVIEVRTDRRRNVEQHRQMWTAVAAACDEMDSAPSRGNGAST